jgi:hypothetical protein
VDLFSVIILFFNSWRFYRTSVFDFFTVFPFRAISLLSPYKSPAKSLPYWHRPHKSKKRLPVLFIPGIGVGIFTYLEFLNQLILQDPTRGEDGDIGAIVIELMPISSRICAPALSNEEMRDEIKKILKKHGWNEFVLVGNS